MNRIKRGGLTLMEVLVVLGILFVIFLIFVPPVRHARELSHRATCASHLKEMTLAIVGYEAQGRVMGPVIMGGEGKKNIYPPGCVGPGDLPEKRLSWMVEILPFVAEESLYKKIDWQQGYAGNLQVTQENMKIFQCPYFTRNEKEESDEEKIMTQYIAMAGVGLDAPGRPAGAPGNGFMGYERITTSQMIKDGTSSTIAFMETGFQPGHWARGGPSTLRGLDPKRFAAGDPLPFGGIHPGGMNVGILDGRVLFVSFPIKPEKLAGLVTIDGNEPFLPD